MRLLSEDGDLKQYTFLDLFCGAGGLALGFTRAGFRSVYAVDSDKAAAQTYRTNFGHDIWDRPIEELMIIPEGADVVIGGPPCQGFSPLGKMSPIREHSYMNRLWQHYFRFVAQINPVAFVIENVPEFLRSAEYEAVRKRADSLGYKIAASVLYAVNYGVPQQRRRAFVVG